MEICEEFVNKIVEKMQNQKEFETAILASNIRIEDALAKLIQVEKASTERYLVNGYSIVKQGNYEVSPVDSVGYERARIFCSIGFNENTTGGISFDLYYAGHRIGEIMEIKPTGSGVSAGSEAFDINQLGGFNLVAINHDVGQPVVINSLKIVLYNE